MNTQTQEALKMAIEALAKCKEAYLAGPNWQKVGYDILDKSQQACKKALEQPAQEPVAVQYLYKTNPNNPELIPLYTHPAPSWQGLSDDEVIQIYISDPAIASYDDPQLIKYAHAIEAKLKEKNT